MPLTLSLPTYDGALEPYTLRAQPLQPEHSPSQPACRVAYAAAHVVSDPLAATDPRERAAVDWDRTVAYREYLWSLGLGVAEAMDTAQRGMGMDWPQSLELIRRTVAASRRHPGARVASGCGTDQLDPHAARGTADVVAAYEAQMEAIEAAGSPLVIMASRALARVARGPEDYLAVYDRILSQARQPVILHWLGEMFDPALAGYWGASTPRAAMDTVLEIIRGRADRIDGIKISLLDKVAEISLRRRLPEGVRMYTGDDFNYAELIAGDGQGDHPGQQHSDALLGIFDAIAPAASLALGALSRGDRAAFDRILAPTVPLSRHLFHAPTRYYKTGVVFMAWLNGHQSHFTMVGGEQASRSLPHLARIFRLADACGCLAHPERAVHRMRQWLAVHGID